MPSEIRVSVEALNAAIQNYKTKKDAMKMAYLQISNVVRELGSTWKGASASKFADQFDALYKNLQQTEEQMDSATQKLEKARDIYQQTEEAARTAMSNVEEGTSPTFF